MIKRGGVAAPISPNLTEKERWRPKRYCTKCNYRSPDTVLRPRIYEKDEVAGDSDQWIQCYHCGTKYLDERVMRANMLTSDIQPLSATSHVAKQGSEKAPPVRHERGFNPRLEKQTGDTIKDPDIKRELKSGAKLLWYSET